MQGHLARRHAERDGDRLGGDDRALRGQPQLGPVGAHVGDAVEQPRWREVAAATAHLWGHSSHYAVEHPGAHRTHTSSTVACDAGPSPSPDGVILRGPVSKTAVADVYAQVDVLLLILGTGRYVTSGKVYEYLASALPIVSVHDPGNAASDVLRGYPLWFPAADLSPEAVARALLDAAQAARTADRATREACAAFARPLSREAQLRPRVRALLDGRP